MPSVQKVKLNKVDGFAGRNTNHLKYGSHKLKVTFSCVSLMSKGILFFTPEGFPSSAVVLVSMSDGNSVDDSDNYRGSALSSSITKSWDYVLLENNSGVFETSCSHFGLSLGQQLHLAVNDATGSSTTPCSEGRY